jgi:hypothetical protein
MHLFFRVLVAAAIVVQVGDQLKPGGKHMEAKGTFEVKSNPQEATAFEKGMGVGRYEIDKVWLGDFSGTSKVEMLSSYTESTGSMVYVAIEQMTGKLGGKSGSFYVAHKATMTKGDAASGEMNIVVVKGSGTEQLAGLSGQLTILIDATGKHSYVFDYQLP